VRYTAYTVNMTMIRKAIIKRMAELNLNPNQLSEMLKGKIPRRTIYDFLSGSTDARTEVASELMKALKLELVPKRHKRKTR
jgi:predicted transcriptional regulator